ncbi:MAG: ArsR/SmtB family transcription factor [Acidimicrobiia bacterium]
MNRAAAPDRIDAVAHALADGTRRRLLRLVRDRERAAGDLAASFPQMSRPAVSQHLRVLEDAGLVSIRPDGNRRYYRARREGLAEVWSYIDEMWADRLSKLKAVAEHAEQTRPDARPARRKR